MFMQDVSRFQFARPVVLPLEGHEAPAAGRRPGLLSGALVETPQGWRAVETLAPGLLVATLDGGFRPLLAVERHALCPDDGEVAIHVPGGALGCCSALDLMPGQEVLVASPVAEDVLGAAGAVVRAATLAGFFGIARRPVAVPRSRVVLRFASDETVFANSGALVHCPAGVAEPEFFPRLDDMRAAAMLALVEAGARCCPAQRMAA